jgi:nucleotide-binding universal stress UspA family protein
MSVVAGVDLSPASLHAARAAAQFAHRARERLILVRALEPVSAFYPEIVLAGAPDVDAEVRKANEEALENIRVSLGEEHPEREIEVRIVAGKPHEVLTSVARDERAWLVVMGAHGRNGAGRLRLGAVAQKTLDESASAVLVLREDAEPFTAWLGGQRPLRVAVGVDRGPASDAAVAWVASLRAAGPVEVTLVHEYWPPGEYTRLGLRGPRAFTDTDPEIVSVLERELRAHLGQIGDIGAFVLRIHPGWGPIGVELAREAEAIEADLLVVGSRQLHGWDRLLHGSHALAALHAAHTPLVTVPAPRQPLPAPADTPIPAIRSVLLATDLSPLGNLAIPHAYSLVPRAGGRVELCYVEERALPTPSYLYAAGPGLSARVRREREAALVELIPKRAAELGIVSTPLVIDGGKAAEQILGAARRLGVDAIVMSSHGRSGVSRALVGSVTDAVLRGSERPVYVVRAERT